LSVGELPSGYAPDADGQVRDVDLVDGQIGDKAIAIAGHRVASTAHRKWQKMVTDLAHVDTRDSAPAECAHPPLVKLDFALASARRHLSFAEKAAVTSQSCSVQRLAGPVVRSNPESGRGSSNPQAGPRQQLPNLVSAMRDVALNFGFSGCGASSESCSVTQYTIRKVK